MNVEWLWIFGTGRVARNVSRFLWVVKNIPTKALQHPSKDRDVFCPIAARGKKSF